MVKKKELFTTKEKIKWKLIVEYSGEKVKDNEAKFGELEVVEFGGSMVTLKVNGKDVTDLVSDKRRTKVRSIVDEAMGDIESEFEMNWGRHEK